MICFGTNAQQYNNWYFGRKAGLKFNSTPTQPEPLVLSNSAMLSDEANATISDENGDLLFYTNGTVVYNKLHQIMLNGADLDGYISSAQIAIVPVPGNDSLYYIFTTGAIETNFTSGYKYSIVNMNRDNGNGEVVVKNTLLWQSCTERLTTARHANGIDVWVITNDNNSNIFRSWLITCNGIEPAIISTTGVILSQYSSINSGVMKVTPNGKKICQTHFPFFDENSMQPNFVQLLDFDNATGIISNPISIGFPDAQITHCEFSPDSKLLYLTRPSDKKIDQLDISSATLSTITASRLSLPTNGGYFDLQLAPDEKIYVANPSLNLAVINKPNLRGVLCDLRQEAISLLPGTSYIGLPSHINDIVFTDDPNNGFNYTILDSCSGNVQFQGYTNMTGNITWFWDFGDGTTSALQNPIHTFIPSGLSYFVKLKITSGTTCGSILRSKNIKPQGIITNTLNFEFKDICDSGYVRFTNTSSTLNDAGTQFIWDFGDGFSSTAIDPTHNYNSPGFYTVKLKMLTGVACLNDSITKIVTNEAFIVNASPDRIIRVGESVTLSYAGPEGLPEWSPPVWLNDFRSKSPVSTPLENIVYKITITNARGCKATDSLKITVLQYDEVYVPKAFTPNNDGKNESIKPFYPGTVTLKEFSIFNRWGSRIFSTSKRGAGWDGKIKGILQSTSVYVWTFNGVDEKTGTSITKKGTLTLIR